MDALGFIVCLSGCCCVEDGKRMSERCEANVGESRTGSNVLRSATTHSGYDKHFLAAKEKEKDKEKTSPLPSSLITIPP